MFVNKVNESNAKRFINAYNRIDNALRAQEDMRRSISYTEAIKRASRTNEIVRKYEDDLIDYGRLRNAIVHNSEDGRVIAEPHLDVVENYEKIADLICTPPLAIETVCNKNFHKMDFNNTLAEVMKFIYQNSVSNLPIYKDGMLIGVANATKITKVLGEKISSSLISRPSLLQSASCSSSFFSLVTSCKSAAALRTFSLSGA